jgi:hypothetical protein
MGEQNVVEGSCEHHSKLEVDLRRDIAVVRQCLHNEKVWYCTPAMVHYVSEYFWAHDRKNMWETT